MEPRRSLLYVLCIWCVLGLALPLAAGQEPPPAGVSSAAPEPDKRATLLDIVRTIEQLERDRAARQAELRSPQAEGRQEEITQQIQAIGEKLRKLRASLNEIASGVNPELFATKKEEPALDWQRKLLEFLEPVLNELGRLTAHSRDIDRLQTAIASTQEHRRWAEQALDNLHTLVAHTTDPLLVPSLQRLQQEWEQRLQEINTQLRIANQQLQQQIEAQPSVAKSIHHLFQLFFRTRGRNLLLAGLAFALCWLLFHWLLGWIERVSPLHRNGLTFAARLFNVVYMGCTILGAVLASQLVLYLLGDWVLLTVSLIFLLGIAWTSRTMLPRFWGQTMLMLNLGSMREGERVLYNSVPWRVRSLHFYARLVNPALQGGDIRLPLNDCLTLRSRVYVPDEPWFPTRQGDWVLLEDQTLGKVVLQTPEVVKLVLLGGSQRIVNTPHFMAQSPLVLSTGFRLQTLFGLDYQHQAQVTREIPAQLATRIEKDLIREGHQDHIVRIAVEFDEAAASALNVRVIADFTGAAAPSFNILRRALQRICVEACNDCGWVIPFTQVTLHVASASNHRALPELDDATTQADH